eukprot:jgi/Botrbrau1/9503/Bobra.0252s0118.1
MTVEVAPSPDLQAGPSLTVDKKVVAEPLKEVALQGRNGKYVRECLEINLGKRGIQCLRGFERLANLVVLWLDKNFLDDLEGLQCCLRLKSLHLEGNKIRDLSPLAGLKFLEELDVSRNCVGGLEHNVVPVVGAMQFLLNLNLMENPLCKEPGYRDTVIFSVPSLEIFDLSRIVQHDLDNAAKHRQKHTPMFAFGGKAPPTGTLKPKVGPLRKFKCVYFPAKL